jgi:hypothetical protein
MVMVIVRLLLGENHRLRGLASRKGKLTEIEDDPWVLAAAELALKTN